MMSIVARGSVFYIEQSSVLSPNIPLRAQVLISVHAAAHTIAPKFLVILLHHRDYSGVMDTTGKIRHIEGRGNSLFYCSRNT